MRENDREKFKPPSSEGLRPIKGSDTREEKPVRRLCEFRGFLRGMETTIAREEDRL